MNVNKQTINTIKTPCCPSLFLYMYPSWALRCSKECGILRSTVLCRTKQIVKCIQHSISTISYGNTKQEKSCVHGLSEFYILNPHNDPKPYLCMNFKQLLIGLIPTVEFDKAEALVLFKSFLGRIDEIIQYFVYWRLVNIRWYQCSKVDNILSNKSDLSFPY